MRRFVTVTVTVAATALALALGAAAPASAEAVTQTQVRRALLTASQVGDGWHLFDGSGNPSADVTGCDSADTTTVGLRHEAGRMFQWSSTAQFVNEEVQSFGTARAARTDFAKGLRNFSACDTLTVDGRPWRVSRLTVRAYADQQALFLLTGSVPTAAGDVPITMFMSAARWGRHEVLTMATVGGQITAAQRLALRKGAVRLSARATAKVARRLGR